MKKLLFGVILATNVVNVHATDLLDIYKESLEYDPTFRNAYNTYMANRENLPQARSALLPQVSVAGLAGRNVFHLGTPSIFNISGTYYNSANWQVNASQALFNYAAWAKLKQAKASVRAAEATFNDAAQDLILRVAKSYFDVLYAQDTLNFAEAKKRANKRQYDQAQQRYEVGLDAITSVYEAKAAYDQSSATVIAARNNKINRNEQLRLLTNQVYDSLAPLVENKLPLVKPSPNDPKVWVDTGLHQNYKLMAAQCNLEMARNNMKALSAGNWPTLALQGYSTQTYNEVGREINPLLPQSQGLANIALAVNFPVFQGGLVRSQTRQAQYNFKATADQLENTYRSVVVNSRVAFNTIKDGISKVKADRQTIVSQKNSLESTEAQFEVGTRTMVDVVNSQQRLFEAQEQLARDQYDLIYAVLRLKYQAGTLSVGDLEQVNTWLATTRLHGNISPQPIK